MIFNGFNNLTRQREICLLSVPVLMKQRDGFTRRIQNKLVRQQGLGGKMGKLVLE